MIRHVLALFTLALAAMAPAAALELEVAAEHASVVRLPGDASAIIIGNPAIADALVHDQRTLVITGRVPGRTNIIAVDRIGRVIFSHDIVVTAASNGQVALYRGPDRTTFSCGTTCEEAPAVGDGVDSFGETFTQQQQRMGAASTAAGDN